MRTRNNIKVVPMRPSSAKLTSKLIRKVISGLEIYNVRARRVEMSKYTPVGLTQMQAEDESSVMIAILEKRPVGFCLSRYDDGVIWLAWFGVLGDCRRMGVGAALLDALERTVPRRKCHKIWCDTRASNLPSQRLLKKVGFRRLCKLAEHWYGQDFYLWEKFVR